MGAESGGASSGSGGGRDALAGFGKGFGHESSHGSPLGDPGAHGENLGGGPGQGRGGLDAGASHGGPGQGIGSGEGGFGEPGGAGPRVQINFGPGVREEASGEVEAGLQRTNTTEGQGAAVSGRQRARGGTLLTEQLIQGLADVTRKTLLGQ